MCGASHSLTLNTLSHFSQHWPFSLDQLPPSTYLVGGAVRDALLGRTAQQLDLDFVLAERSVETASEIARYYDAGFVLLDADRQIARIVFEQATADFALQVGSSLEIDLYRRDFTINAIAYNPRTGAIYDPVHGYQDLQSGLVRMVSLENLCEDPLRLLRAYRQAAQLNFVLDLNTQQAIRQLSSKLSTVAAERVQAELRSLLSLQAGTFWLIKACQDGLLQSWLPHATAQRLSALEAMEHAILALDAQCPGFTTFLHQRVRDSAFAPRSDRHAPDLEDPPLLERSWQTIAKLTCLVSPVPQQAELELTALKFSRAELRAALTVLKHLPYLLDLPATVSLRDQYFLFQDVGPVFPAMAAVAVAQGGEIMAISALVQRFLTPGDPVAHPFPLLTGEDLIKTFNLRAGPQIGRLLAAIQLAQAEGNVTTLKEALVFSAQLLERE